MRFDQLGTTAGLMDSVSKKQLSSVNGKIVQRHRQLSAQRLGRFIRRASVQNQGLNGDMRALSFHRRYVRICACRRIRRYTFSWWDGGTHVIVSHGGCSGSVHARTFTARQEARCEVRLRFVCQPVDTTGARDGSEQQRREIFH